MKTVPLPAEPPSRCEYLPDRLWQFEHQSIEEMSPAEYESCLAAGWRRFGHLLFRPRCESCTLCRSLRIPVRTFEPNRSQRRVRRMNDGAIELEIGTPRLDHEAHDLYLRFHREREEKLGWPKKDQDDPLTYFMTFLLNPFATEEWRYRIGSELVGVGYVDALPDSLSAIYFFHSPEHERHSLGTWNVLSLIERARETSRANVYLGYYVPGCRSMEYKSRFRPFELFGENHRWRIP